MVMGWEYILFFRPCPPSNGKWGREEEHGTLNFLNPPQIFIFYFILVYIILK